jgi:hypothetical protein
MNKHFHNVAHTRTSIPESSTVEVSSIPEDHSFPSLSSSPLGNPDFPDWKRIPSFDKIPAPVSIFEYFTEGKGKRLSDKSQSFFVNELEEPGLGIVD